MSLVFPVCVLLCSTALMEEPPKEVVLRTSGDASMQESFSSQSFQMSASRQEASFSSSSSMTEMKFASMSAQSMSAMKESFVEMSSSSIMGKSSLTQLESSTSRMLKSGMRGEQIPLYVELEKKKKETRTISWCCLCRITLAAMELCFS